MSDFDDLFKDRFKDLEAEVPDDMWSRIQANQAPEDVKKPILVFWKWSILAVLGISIVGITGIILYNSAYDTEIDCIDDVNHSKFAFDPTHDNDLSQLLLASSSLDNEEKLSTESTVIKLVSSSVDIQYSTDTAVTMSFMRSNEIASSSSLLQDETIKTEIQEQEVQSKDFSSAVEESMLNEKKSITPFHLNKSVLDFSDAGLPDYANKCPKFGKSYHGYYSIELYHGSDFNTKNINARAEEYNDYALDRTETEKRRYSYSNGLKFKWHNNSGLELGMGVERSVIRERFMFSENAREVKVLISIDTTFSSDGSYTTFTDTTRIDIPGTKQNSITNKYTSIDIPIFIGYQFELNRWAIGIQAGIYINLLQQQNGRILGLNGKPAWIGEEVDNSMNVFKSKTGLKFDGSVSIVYHLTSNIDILAQPYFRYNNHSYTNESYPLEQFYHTAGIRAGVRYNFGF